MKYYIYRAYFLLFPVMVSVMGCGAPDMPHGINIKPEPYTLSEVEDVVDQVITTITNEAKPSFRKDLDTILRVNIDFTSDPEVAINCGGKLTGGCTSGVLDKDVLVVPESRIVGCTALAHELIHTAGFDHEGENWDTDVDHTIWWSQYDPLGSIEGRLFEMLCNEPIRAGVQEDW